ncbi:MAG: cell division protein ZapA [Deltaproteobacteria bacterium]|nr:cell division protein ZapA [Deltaproteobacteria bacterium]MBW2076039.1 cell division protein ZapA [Deltaproteobacteria bacterium]MBW2309508.1 cell division protein ZapA [Deltaproteobacteria bacterium]
MGETVTITIKDREYTIRGADDKDRILKVAAYVDQKLKEIRSSSKGLTDEKAAILAALDIAGDYLQLIKEKEDLLREINNRSQNMILSINTVLQ